MRGRSCVLTGFLLLFYTVLLPRFADATEQQPMGAPQSSEHYGTVTIVAEGVKQDAQQGLAVPAAVDVYINGRKVGATPYRDGLPAGLYVVELRNGEVTLHSQWLSVTAGRHHELKGRVVIPLTAEELRAYQEQQRQQREAQTARREQQLAPWRVEHQNWQTAVDEIGPRHTGFLVSGVLLAVSGVGLSIAGVAFEVQARTEQDKATSHWDKWRNDVSPEGQQYHEERAINAEETRDKNNVLGITFLSIGGAALVSSVVMFILMPALPVEPKPPAGLSVAGLHRLNLRPIFAPNLLGAGLTGRF